MASEQVVPPAEAGADDGGPAPEFAVETVAVTATGIQGHTFELLVPRGVTVANLKGRIAAAGGPPVKTQRLCHGATVLANSETLFAAGLVGSAALTLVQVRPRYAGVATTGDLGSVGTIGDLFSERSFTVEAWVRVRAFNTGNQGDNAILGCHRFDKNRALVCQLRNGVPFMGFYYNDVAAKSKVALDTWTHLAFAYDLEKREQSIHVNGELAAARSPSEPLQGSYDVVIGDWAFGGRFLNGEIALLNIWSRALTTEMVQESMATGAPDAAPAAGLVRSYSFECDGDDSRRGGWRVEAVGGERMGMVESVRELEDAPF